MPTLDKNQHLEFHQYFVALVVHLKVKYEKSKYYQKILIFQQFFMEINAEVHFLYQETHLRRDLLKYTT